jgi:hypothetical protein
LWVVALTITLLLHVATWLGVRALRPFSPRPVQARPPEPIDLVFVEPEPEPAPQDPKPEEPTFFTELPPDRAQAPPEQADFLSNVDSRARDMVPGGEENLPRQTGDAEFPSVEMTPDGGPAGEIAPDAATVDAETTEPREPPPTPPTSADGFDARAAQQARRQSGLVKPGTGGRADLYQPEMSNPAGDAELLGDISLNTLAWDYAPWLQRFRRELMRRWYAPTAYYMGILKEGGWSLVEMEVSLSGEMLRLDLLEEQGHASLTQASLEALQSTAPLEPLPGHFPEPTLVLRIRMIYPKVRTR